MIDLVFRPYAFPNHGDDVADAAGRAWRFDGPLAWQPYDQRDGVPTWPLILLDDERRTQVATATTTGSHETELQRWRRATQAEPPARRSRTRA